MIAPAANPRAPRYKQYEGFKLIAELLNEQLIYMQHNPRTNSPIGWSPVETLVRIIEAALYAEDFDFDYLKQNAPEGIIDLGPGTTKQELEEFREYYEREIAGTRAVAIFGGGADLNPNSEVSFKPFNRNDNFETRLKYKKWLAQICAVVFEIDLTSIGMTENVNRANGKTGQEQSDTGLVGLAATVARYISREIVWEIDEDHGFVFDGIVPRDELTQAKIDQLYSQIGVTTPNEIRARDGLPPVEWGDEPYNAAGSPTPQLDEDGQSEPDGDEPDPGDDGAGGKKGAKRSALVPFGAASRARTPARRKSSAASFTA